MKFKICIIMLFLNCRLQASNSETPTSSSWNVDDQISKINEQTVEFVKNQEFIRKTELLECAGYLDNLHLSRVQFKIVRNTLETHWQDMQKKELIRAGLDKITEKHKRCAPFFLGYVCKKDLNDERLDLKRALTQSLSAEHDVQMSSTVIPSAPTHQDNPIEATAVRYDNKNNNN